MATLVFFLIAGLGYLFGGWSGVGIALGIYILVLFLILFIIEITQPRRLR